MNILYTDVLEIWLIEQMINVIENICKCIMKEDGVAFLTDPINSFIESERHEIELDKWCLGIRGDLPIRRS